MVTEAFETADEAWDWLTWKVGLDGEAEAAVEGLGTIGLKIEADHDVSPFDYDSMGSLIWPDRHWADEHGRPSGCDGSARKMDTRSGPVWWMPDVHLREESQEVIAETAERVRRYLHEDWYYVGIVLTVKRAGAEDYVGSVWGIESDSDAGFFRETANDLFAELPPMPEVCACCKQPLPPVS